MTDKTYNLLFVGVGGQGVLLAAEITALTATRLGHDVKQTEVHGVSQRGGSVETHLRFGPKVYSPIVTPGQADVLIALENLEALRFAHFVNKEIGAILTNDFELVPGSVVDADSKYPRDALTYLQGQGFRLHVLKASEIARDLGDGRMANVVLLGALSHLLPLPYEEWRATLETRIPPKYRGANIEAFEAGRAHEASSAQAPSAA